jgi:hypothetical protein
MSTHVWHSKHSMQHMSALLTLWHLHPVALLRRHEQQLLLHALLPTKMIQAQLQGEELLQSSADNALMMLGGPGLGRRAYALQDAVS